MQVSCVVLSYIISDVSLAHKFHELNQAYELLLDPIRKTTLDASLRVKFARKERFAKFDGKRKAMQVELEEAERAVKKAKESNEKARREREEEADRIKEEGRKMRQGKEHELKKEEERKLSDQKAVEAASKLGRFFFKSSSALSSQYHSRTS